MNDEARWLSLTQAIRREVSTHFRNWTETNDHDPGVTLLNMFAWLTEQLLSTRSLTNPQRSAAARRLAITASAWMNATSDADSEALLRPNYFAGKLLTADDLRDEQTYFRQRLRRLNLRLHGRGIVSGLTVSIKGKGTAARIEIAPGVAIDPTGEEIVVTKRVTLPLPIAAQELYVQIRWVERPSMPVPAIDAPTDSSPPAQYSRIADTWETVLSPIAAQDAVTLARLKRISGRWTIGAAKTTGKPRKGKR
jgi:hypothetical protein